MVTTIEQLEQEFKDHKHTGVDTRKVMYQDLDGGAPAPDVYKVKISSDDNTPDYIEGKITAGSNITATVINPGAAETLQIDTTETLWPEVIWTTDFAAAAQFATAATNGSWTIPTTGGAYFAASGTSAYGTCYWQTVNDTSGQTNLFNNNFKFSVAVEGWTNTDCDEAGINSFLGICDHPTVDGANPINMAAVKHAGFALYKAAANGDDPTVIATSGNGSSATTTTLVNVPATQALYALKYTAGSKIEFWYKTLPSGAWTKGATHTTNMPTGETGHADVVLFAITSNTAPAVPSFLIRTANFIM